MATLVPSVPSDLSICTAACVLIGAAPITSFDDPTAEARIANEVYEMTVRAALGRYRWGFANVIADLGTPDSAVPKAFYDYAYLVPTSPPPMAIHGVFVADQPVAFERYDKYLYTDASQDEAPVIVYGYRAAEKDFAPYFVKALTLELAGLFASSVTMNSSLAAEWTDRAMHPGTGAWDQAIAIDAQGRTPRRIRAMGRITRMSRG
jgi:hypothetical protein